MIVLEQVTLEEYTAYNVELVSDRDTPDQVKESFRIVSDNAPLVSKEQLQSVGCDAEYFASVMPATTEGQLDYEAFVDKTFQ